jgi:hypothetical protein
MESSKRTRSKTSITSLDNENGRSKRNNKASSVIILEGDEEKNDHDNDGQEVREEEERKEGDDEEDEVFTNETESKNYRHVLVYLYYKFFY